MVARPESQWSTGSTEPGAHKKRAPCGARVHKVEDSRRRLSLKGGKRRLRTCVLKAPGTGTTSKMAVNLRVKFMVDMHHTHDASSFE